MHWDDQVHENEYKKFRGVKIEEESHSSTNEFLDVLPTLKAPRTSPEASFSHRHFLMNLELRLCEFENQ